MIRVDVMMRRCGLLILFGLAALGCDDTINLASFPPEVAMDSLEVAGPIVDVYYRAADIEGDDFDITIAVCRGNDCFTPTSVPGGDGTRNLPTVRRQTVLHLFRWAPGCDVDESEFDEPRVIRITPSDGLVGETAETEPFTLSGLGVDGACPGGS